MVREFSDDVSKEELEWHMDRRDRRITVIEGDGWKLQLESGLPFTLVEGSVYSIPRASWHRIIKGNGALRILIDES